MTIQLENPRTIMQEHAPELVAWMHTHGNSRASRICDSLFIKHAQLSSTPMNLGNLQHYPALRQYTDRMQDFLACEHLLTKLPCLPEMIECSKEQEKPKRLSRMGRHRLPDDPTALKDTIAHHENLCRPLTSSLRHSLTSMKDACELLQEKIRVEEEKESGVPSDPLMYSPKTKSWNAVLGHPGQIKRTYETASLDMGEVGKSLAHIADKLEWAADTQLRPYPEAAAAIRTFCLDTLIPHMRQLIDIMRDDIDELPRMHQQFDKVRAAGIPMMHPSNTASRAVADGKVLKFLPQSLTPGS
jgi:hypothetical protein